MMRIKKYLTPALVFLIIVALPFYFAPVTITNIIIIVLAGIISVVAVYFLNQYVGTAEQKELRELKLVSKQKENLIALTSQDVRTPMTPIKANLQLLIKGTYGQINPKQEIALKTILRNTERLDDTILNMLDLSRIGSKTLKLQKKDVIVRKVVRDVLEELRNYKSEKHIEIKLDMNKEHMIYTDEQRLKQILKHILSNAIKVSPLKGLVLLKIEEKGNSIIFSVKDSGLGISKKDLEIIFDPFSQVEGVYAPEGAGIGLSLCMGVVEQLGGKMFAESTEGTGSTFAFSLPIKP